MAKTPTVGELAPDFTLPGIQLIDGQAVKASYTLSEHRGSPLVVAFYPGDDTPVCTRQLCNYSSGLDEFINLGAEVWAVSGQSIASHEKFARKHNLKMPLLADTEKVAADIFGISTLSPRSTYVIDASGILRWKNSRLLGATYAKGSKITDVLKQLTPA